MAKKREGDGYQEAQRRIAEAKRTDATELTLTGLGLTALPAELWALSGLQRLDLWGNQLTALPTEIGSLSGLQTLDLHGNQLTTLPTEIGSLTALQTLDLRDNQLTTLPPEVGALSALESLWLPDNQLTALPPQLGALIALRELRLQRNQFTTLPPQIAALTELRGFSISGNQLTTLPAGIGDLVRLESLWLQDNQLSALPPEIGSLSALQTLDLGGNQLTTLPPEIGSLSALQDLDLTRNQLSALPAELGQLTNLSALYLHDNPVLGMPPEILGPPGPAFKPPRELLDYYFSTAAGSRALREVKLILVGRGEVGKTTLADVLQGKPFKKNRPPTDGIKITPWSVTPKGGAAVIRIWDFGGQQIMHGTHQFFLTKRAIYIVMIDGRDDRYQREAEYWLKLVRAFGGDSTVMVIMNRQKDYKFDLDRNALATKYDVSTDLFFPTECSQKKTITPVRKAIQQLVAEILSTQSKFPAKWWKIKTHLEQMEDDHLSDKEYRALCREHDIDDDDEQDQLLDRLNDLGTIVHFGDDDTLADLKVLNPEWATDGVYWVMTNEKLREAEQGKLKAGALKDILPRKRWPEAKHRRYILQLMLRFDLCFPAEGENDVYIVPELLLAATPDFSDWDPKDGVVFRYGYPVLPHGILPRFISKTHTLSERRERWRSGVVIAKDGAEALVRADYDESTVDIWVRGQYRDARRALLTIIRSKFDETHARIKELNPEEMVGMPPDPTVFVSYQDMILDERDGQTTVRVTISGARVEIPLDDILSGVESPKERRKAAEKAIALTGDGKTNVAVHGDYIAKGDKHMRDDHSINIGGDVINAQVGQTLTNCTNTIQQQAPGEKKDLLEELRGQVQELIKQLPEDKKEEAPRVAKNLETLVNEATNSKPDRKWYSLSADGLLEASKWTKDFAGNIVGTIGQLEKLIWPDYSPRNAD